MGWRYGLSAQVLTALCAVCGMATSNPSALAGDDVRVLVRFHQPPGLNEVAAVNRHRGVITRQFRLVPAVAATVPAASLARLRTEAGVAAVELDSEVVAHEISTVWGVERIWCGPVHDGTFAATGAVPVLGDGIRVGVMDTGIDYTHPQLAPNYVGGYDFVNGDTDPWDDHYHGTHVAGTIAAIRDGVQAVGVAPNVDLYGIKVLGANGSGSWSGIIAGLDWAVAEGLHVVNLSLGSSGDPGSTVRAAFDNAYAAGLIIVASAGNSGSGTNTVGFPAQYSSAIAVASTTSSDARSSFSSTGPAVELAAPGSSIYSTYPGNSYAYLSGTSMAAPHVSGTAALVLAAGVVDANNDGRLNDDVRIVLQTTAEDLGAGGVDNEFGYGLIDAEFAVTMVFDPEGGGGDPPGPAPIYNAPSNLPGSASASDVTLTWLDNSNVEDGFEVQSGTKVKGQTAWSPAVVLSADTTAHTYTSLADGTYRFRVRAIRTGYSATAWSEEIQVSVGSTKGGGKTGGGGGGGKGRNK